MRPTSDQSKEAAGTLRPSISRQPLPVPVGRPEPPEWLSVSARKAWDFVISDLEKTGCLASVDQTMLAMYAQLTSELAGDPMEFTAAKYTQLRLICGELGLSISSRLKLRSPDGKAPNDGDKWKPKPSGKVVNISSLLSGTPRGSLPETLKPADTSAAPAKDS